MHAWKQNEVNSQKGLQSAWISYTYRRTWVQVPHTGSFSSLQDRKQLKEQTRWRWNFRNKRIATLWRGLKHLLYSKAQRECTVASEIRMGAYRASSCVLVLLVLDKFNRPIPSCLMLLCQRQSSCETILKKVCSPNGLIFMRIKLIFMTRFARGLVLKQRHNRTRKWPIKKHVPLNVKSYLFQNLALVFDNHSYSAPLLHEVDHLFRVKRGLGYHLQSRAYHTADLPRRGGLGQLWHLVWVQQGSITAALVEEDLILVVVKTFRTWRKYNHDIALLRSRLENWSPLVSHRPSVLFWVRRDRKVT